MDIVIKKWGVKFGPGSAVGPIDIYSNELNLMQ